MWSSNCWWGNGLFHGGLFGPVVGFIIWGLVLFGIVLVLSRLFNHPARATGVQDAPLDILKRRYAAGDIDSLEFEKRKRDLSS
ncbi:MAG: hypothetical protein A2X56_09595 [Nitrospirae bacterium GWC2_57_13]|nr:MAG: hypothetical protein A2072_04225 [Nitrospirae bacterium GWC1_57_7]OGW27411.1 MAG: hypothetical protein A2X56_09595 [Nitrospirae bacterium GWC2_57_13]OGW44813.1 MAG: hypothetical protein A2X57_11780 [Nitrospirae bacterium GWD2_57_8]